MTREKACRGGRAEPLAAGFAPKAQEAGNWSRSQSNQMVAGGCRDLRLWLEVGTGSADESRQTLRPGLARDPAGRGLVGPGGGSRPPGMQLEMWLRKWSAEGTGRSSLLLGLPRGPSRQG